MTRRRFLVLAGLGLGGLAALRFGLPPLLRPGPRRPMGAAARALLDRCFEGIDRSRMWDSHVHVVGLGSGDSGCWLNPDMQSHLHPVKRFQFDVFAAALGMERPETADRDYIERLLALHRRANPQGKLLLLAFEQFVDENGRPDRERSPFFTPNQYVLELARRHPEALACVSIHPYRPDAVERLDAAVEAGALAVKWLPNTMGIDPASPLCDRFYRRLADLNLPLISHAGDEYAVEGGHAQEFGNPLRLRRPLDAGVRVIVAHCASFGSSPDLDAPAAGRRELPAFDLFLRLMGEKQYERTLYADISALIQINRSGRPLREMLQATELHPRLLHGTDYPLATIGFLFSTKKLELQGYLTAEERTLCNEIHRDNPLLFDFAVKRCVKVERDGRTYRFPPSVFETAHVFARPA